MSNMTVLARDLRQIGANPVVCFNNKKLLHISHYKTYAPGITDFADDCVYIVTDRETSATQRLMSEPANFIFLGNAPHNMERRISKDTNVIFIDIKTPLSELHSSVQRCCNAFSIFSKYSEQMLQAVLQKDSVNDYINVCAEMFDRSVLLLRNNELVITAYPESESASEIEMDVVKHVCAKEYDWIPGAQNDISYPELISVDDKAELLLTSFCPDGQNSFKLCVVYPSRDFSGRDCPLAARIAEMLVRILSSGAAFESPVTFAQFFDRTVSSTNLNRTMTISRAASLNFKPSSNSYMYMVYSDSDHRHDFTDVIGHINRDIKGIVFPYHSRIIVISEEPQASCTEQIKDVIKKEKAGWKFVRSLAFASAADLKRAYSECMNAQRVNRYYSIDDTFIAYEYLSSALLLLRYQELSDDITDLALPIAKTIIDYDARNGTDYKNTLALYIRTFKNIQVTADTLHVHRNTIHFRLQKMTELFGIDFDDYRLLHNIGFSLDVYDSAGIFRELSM